MLVKGNVTAVKAFPSTTISQANSNSSQPKLYEVSCSSRQQLISVGRTRSLQYTYFWKEPLDRTGSPPEVSVTDLAGAKVDPGESTTLPRSGVLRFKSTFDGELIVFNNSGRIVDKRKISSEKYVELDGLSYDVSLQVVVGLDVVWELRFKKQQPIDAKDELEVLKQITNVPGETIPTPHSLRNMLLGMNRYPQICQWIRKCIRNGTIGEQSYRRLQTVYRSMSMNR